MRNYLLTGYMILFFACSGIAQDAEDGYTQFYYPNGKVSSEGIMKDGRPDGYWKTYYVTGVIKSEGLRTNFELDSTWNFYNQSGEIIQKIDYKYGKKNGYSYEYSYDHSPKGVVVSKELYVNGKKEGISFYFHENGELKQEINYDKGQKEGPSREYNERGNLITLLEYHNNYLISRERINKKDAEGKKQGSWKIFYPDGRINKEMYYKDNQLHGLYKEYNQNGTLAVVLRYENGKIVEDDKELLVQQEIDVKREFDEEGNLIFTGSYRDDGTAVGLHRFYNSEGEVINAKIHNEFGKVVSKGIVDDKGNKEGQWKDFYFSGAIRAAGQYLNNRKHGKWQYFYENGQVEQEGLYRRGLPDGLWKWYYQNGNLLREENFFNGREDGLMVEYDVEGNIITQGEFLNGEKEGEWEYQIGDHIEKGNYQTGLREGLWKYYYNDGTLHFEGEFSQGMAQGKHKYYYPSGELKEERYYEMGLKEKNWKKFDDEGNLEMTITYRNDLEYRINGIKINLPKGSISIIK